MKKLYFFLMLSLLISGVASAQSGKGVIKFKTGKFDPESGKIKGFRCDILVRMDNPMDPDLNTKAPIIGKDITIEGGELENALPKGVADQKFNLWVTAPEVTLRGDFVDVSLANCDMQEIDISGCPDLYCIRVNENPIHKLVIGTNPKLQQVWASYCKNLKELDISKNPLLNSVSVQGCDVEQLDLSTCPLITNLNAGENPRLHTIDVTCLPLLQELWVNKNNMTSLDVSKNPELEWLECSGNKLRGLTVEHNPKLTFLSVWDNGIKGKEMDNLINSLAQEDGEKEREFCVYNERSGNKNLCTEDQVDAVVEKGWTAKQAVWQKLGDKEYFQWEAFAGTKVPAGMSRAMVSRGGDGSWYDLQGRRVRKPVAKGVYIYNGKKIVISK